MLAIAFLVSLTLATIQAKRNNINSDIISSLSLLVFISGIIGARILYIIENIGYYIKNPPETIMLQHGGLSWFGGLAFGIFFGIFYLKKKNLSVYKILDLIVPYVSLGQAIGRIGCLLNGCCFGSTIIPVQIYSSLILIFIFIILRLLQDRPHREGEILFLYLVLYSLKRFFIEFLRTDNPVIFLGLTLFQIISIVIFCLALIKLVLIKKIKGQGLRPRL
jgi:phosphatidylglycerol:prolipoprotein diacylglycerol transferase